ncbi:hypothetical protein ARAM_001172 [Aspergillus rambellii]|uniref:Short-chain dehydrogenase/reductase 3 n=1 Tax=Aspergillus rambellii TaxID=308745 RepID=A0A0F8W4I4_9EURO|nr:hypothetical protein ARAM_001172 [Aspergillus rambellii]
MSLDPSSRLVLGQWLQPMIARLPPAVQEVVLHPLAAQVVLVLLALGLLRRTNRYLSYRAVNNGQGSARWDSTRELVVLTGGCSGIGKQMVFDLAQKGVRLVILDINEPNFPLPNGVAFYQADITSSASIAAVAQKIRATHREPTVLINNAGVGHDGTILDEPEAKIRQTFEVNTISHFLTVREFLPSMVRQNHGHVVTIASMASFVALGEMVDYCCTKASALAFHEGLRQELRHFYKAPKIKTTVVHPLWVRTPMIQQLTDAGSQFNQPVMTPEMVSSAVVEQIMAGKSGQIILPAHHWPLSMLRSFPTWMQEMARAAGTLSFVRLREWQQKQT